MKPSGTNDLPRDRSELISLAKKQGWEITRNSIHLVVRNPANGKHANMSFNPSDNHGGVHVFRDELKKAGLLSNDEFHRRQRQAKSLPEPKLVVDRSAPVEIPRIAIVNTKKPVRGEIRDAILAAMARVGDSPQGRSADDILAHVKVYIHNMDRTRLNVAMNGYVKSGIFERVGVGKFRVVPDGARHAPRGIQERIEVPQIVRRPVPQPQMIPTVLDMDTAQDIKELDEILAALGKFERIVRKHQEIARGLAPLKALITAMTNVPAAAPPPPPAPAAEPCSQPSSSQEEPPK
jgi:hypothetical protein